MPIDALTHPAQKTGPELFGDVLALARWSWIRQMADELSLAGYDDYRRTDAAVFRRLLTGPVAIGALGTTMGVSRQAARNVVNGLVQRGYATTERDRSDSRKLNVVLTDTGVGYGGAVVDAIDRLHARIARRVDPDQLASAQAVLREVVAMRDTPVVP